MGFVPSSSWTPADADKYIASLGSSSAAVRSVLTAQEALSIAALVREPGGNIRVVRIGIGDNEAGLYSSSRASSRRSVEARSSPTAGKWFLSAR
jgi:hypothetical protein